MTAATSAALSRPPATLGRYTQAPVRAQSPRRRSTQPTPGQRGGPLSATRTALVIGRGTPFGQMEVAEVDMPPSPKQGEILIETHAAGVNALDWFISNIFRNVPPFLRIGNYVPGRDVSGVVQAVGPGVQEWKPGDEVIGLAAGIDFSADIGSLTPEKLACGAYATHTKLIAEEAARKPSNLSHVEAAGIPLAALTAWIALVEVAQLKEGSKVLILGGAGGVGTLAIQLAKVHCKCSTVATTCSERSMDLVKSVGADLAIDYEKENFEDVLNGQDYDCVVDAIGYDNKCARALKILNKESGILVDLTGPPSLGHLRRKQKTDSFFEYRKGIKEDGDKVRYQLVGVARNGKALRKMSDYFKNQEMRTVTDKVFPGLTCVQHAFDMNRDGLAHGKLVIDIKSSNKV